MTIAQPNESTAQPSRTVAEVVAQLYAPIAEDLARVKALYREKLTSEDPAIATLLVAVEHYSGKMLRPALLLLAAKTIGEVNQSHLQLAVVAEMIHTATLVHDDILDDAVMRRQHPSINQFAGTEVSILLGDHLFSYALQLALELEDPTGAHRFSRAVSRTCLGEVTQVYNRGNLELDEETYYRIVRGKTAELYATSAELGVVYAGGDEHAAASMYDYGLKLGIAFQIMDDLLDLRGDEALVGKTLGTDLANGKMTLPVIHMLASLDPQERSRVIELLKHGDEESSRREVYGLLQAQGSIEYAEAQAKRFVEEACEATSYVKDIEMREFLRGIARFVIERQL